MHIARYSDAFLIIMQTENIFDSLCRTDQFYQRSLVVFMNISINDRIRVKPREHFQLGNFVPVAACRHLSATENMRTVAV